MAKIHDFLGLQESATYDEVVAEYDRQYAVLAEERFLAGEAGNNAARRLTELDSLYKQFIADNRHMDESQSINYDAISALIKQGKLSEAQAELDTIVNRTAEWHYQQSIVFYRKDWHSECRKQLLLALQLEPANTRYRVALEKLDMVMANGSVPPTSLSTTPSGAGANGQATRPRGAGEDSVCGDDMCSCCAGMMLADCCCSMLRCI